MSSTVTNTVTDTVTDTITNTATDTVGVSECVTAMLPPEIVDIIVGFRPWIGLVLSRSLREAALQALHAIPLVPIPEAALTCCCDIPQINQCIAGALARSSVLAYGSHVLNVTDPNCTNTMNVILRPNNTIYVLFRKGVATKTFIMTTDMVIRLAGGHIYVHTPAICVIIKYQGPQQIIVRRIERAPCRCSHSIVEQTLYINETLRQVLDLHIKRNPHDVTAQYTPESLQAHIDSIIKTIRRLNHMPKYRTPLQLLDTRNTVTDAGNGNPIADVQIVDLTPRG